MKNNSGARRIDRAGLATDGVKWHTILSDVNGHCNANSYRAIATITFRVIFRSTYYRKDAEAAEWILMMHFADPSAWLRTRRAKCKTIACQNIKEFSQFMRSSFPESPSLGFWGKNSFFAPSACRVDLSRRSSTSEVGSSKSEAWRLGGHLFRMSANSIYF